MRKYGFLCLLGLVLSPVASEATPIPVNCPGSESTTDREFTLTTDPIAAVCLYSGFKNELNANSSDYMYDLGWTPIFKDESSSSEPSDEFSIVGLGAMWGSFTLDPSLWKTFDRIAIGLVVGGGGTGPKWAVFELPEGEASGMWAQELEHGGDLGHAVLYGKGDGTPSIAEVPEPASLLLLGSGLTLAARRRRSKRRSQKRISRAARD